MTTLDQIQKLARENERLLNALADMHAKYAALLDRHRAYAAQVRAGRVVLTEEEAGWVEDALEELAGFKRLLRPLRAD